MAAAVALSVLKEGLAAIRKHIGPRQNDLEQHIARSESILDSLEDTGALQRANRMAFELLVNPVDEQVLVEKATGTEIYDAVNASRNAQEVSEIRGGDDDVDDDMEYEPCPCCRQALNAVLTLQKYTAAMDDDFARRLDSLLVSFGRQTQLEETNSLVDAPITNYFTPRASKKV
ncbi:hypothetical protein B0H14DRAFT_3130061 [Mycena olivaceomarginata]|nr:hypothetical protein B0H14DRAFT_3130061 [Mycena olivaceomarginata]